MANRFVAEEFLITKLLAVGALPSAGATTGKFIPNGRRCFLRFFGTGRELSGAQIAALEAALDTAPADAGWYTVRWVRSSMCGISYQQEAPGASQTSTPGYALVNLP